MKTLTADQLSSISGETTNLARTLKITNTIGNVFLYTDADLNVPVGSDTYKSSIGFEASAVVSNLGTNLSTASISLLLSSDAIDKPMIEAGLLDGAEVILSAVDWLFPTRGLVELFRGNIQSIEYKDGLIAVFDVEPLLSRDLQLSVDLVSSNCRVDLGSPKCGIDIEALKKTFTIATVANFQQFTTDLTDDDATWDIGLVKFTSGANSGIALEIGSYLKTDGSITLQLLAPYTIAPGDTGVVYPGCDKTAVTCSTIYRNIVNMRAEPFGLNTAVASAVGTPGAGLVTGGAVYNSAPAGTYSICTFAAGNVPTDGASYRVGWGPTAGGKNFLLDNTLIFENNNCYTFNRLSATTGYFDEQALTNSGRFQLTLATGYDTTSASQFFCIARGAVSNIAYGSPTPDRDNEAANANLVSFATMIAAGFLITKFVETTTPQS